jgi:Ca2+-binding EF-hand superfamily protein
MNAKIKEKIEDKNEQQKKYIEVAKNLFQIWDADGEGSLSPDELIKAFVQIGLSQDHHFAKKIMYSIKPPPSKGSEASEFEIK